jgi:hypothetical protein
MTEWEDDERWNKLYKTSAADTEATYRYFIDRDHDQRIAIGLTIATILDKWLSDIDGDVEGIADR